MYNCSKEISMANKNTNRTRSFSLKGKIPFRLKRLSIPEAVQQVTGDKSKVRGKHV